MLKTGRNQLTQSVRSTWMVNTNLSPLDPEECKTSPSAKMTKALRQAWQLASENHGIDFYHDVLKQWQVEQADLERAQRERDEKAAQEAEERAAREAEEAAKEAEEEAKPKKKARKSKGGDGDVEMEDADAPKSSKKRKKDAESDAEGGKVSRRPSNPCSSMLTSRQPKKTPKVTKLNAPKTPNGEASSAKKSASKSKKKLVQAPKDDEEEEKPQMTEAERMAQREKAVLYLRHRLQKGFLSRDQAPQEAEMPAMADFFSQLEGYENLEPSIIRATKVHKVLKAIVKLATIAKDEEYQFKKRSAAMLEVWNKRMEADTDAPPQSATETKPPVEIGEKVAEPVTNGEEAADAAAVYEPVDQSEAKEGAEKEEQVAETLDAKIEAAEEVENEGTSEPVAADEKPVLPAVEAAPKTEVEAEAGDAKAAATSEGVEAAF